MKDIDRKVTEKHFQAVGFGRPGSKAEFNSIQDICIDGFREAAEIGGAHIFEYDAPNASAYLESYDSLLQNLISRVLEIFRFSGGFSSISEFADRAEFLEFRLSLNREKDNAISDFKLSASKPSSSLTHGLGDHELKIAILRIFLGAEKTNRNNVIGRSYQDGPLEKMLNRKFTPEERFQADQCIDALVRDGFLMPTMSDLAAPKDWLTITELGQEALKRGAPDELDAALMELGSHLVELRSGAWSASLSSSPDAARQAAHSARELIIQTLDAVAPIEKITAEPGFQPAKESTSGVTRKMRFRYALKNRKSGDSKNDAEILENAAALLESMHKKMSGLAHQRGAIAERHIKTYLQTTEMALALLLL
ncbi:hypothetical protein [Oricola nitratireducens]|uniref:pPIWI-associating nuclease domain-containing protein n=1 Tax=Oricola nitratireducens TaxID=2775868 RepID=UPI0018681B79|nr:hypothetical protein [Oricola nitratireducens]